MSALDQGGHSRGDVSGVRVRVETEEHVKGTWPRILHTQEAAREAASQERAGSGSRGHTSTLGSREPCVAVSGHGCGPPAAETQHLRQERWHHKGDVGNVMTFSFSLASTLPDFWTSGRWESFCGMITLPQLSAHTNKINPMRKL